MATYLAVPYRIRGSTPTAPRSSIRSAIGYVLLASVTVTLIHLSLIWVAPEHPYTSAVRSSLWRTGDLPVVDGAAYSSPQAGNGSATYGSFHRDPFPLQTILSFWTLAEEEVAARSLDTCQDQLGRRFIEAYHSTEVPYCVPDADPSDDLSEAASSARNISATWRLGDSSLRPTYMTCSAIHRHPFTQWWPYPAAPCLSSNLRMIAGDSKSFHAAGCDVTDEGARLVVEMGNEDFAGPHASRTGLDSDEGLCREVITHTTLLIRRQDQWNPFHVAEDLITTIVTLLLAARNAPDLVEQRIQLVFLEGFGMDQNHFTPLWDRIGAWAPRRLSLDPWGPNVCLTNAIHSVGAGASFLSAMGVGNSYQCASTVTWAASHYYRHLYGLLPPGLPKLLASHSRRPINILWLSRAKLDAYAMKHNDWSRWRGVRHIANEPALMERIRRGIAEFCEGRQSYGACEFQDALEEPERWSDIGAIPENAPIPVRFTSIDPTVHAIGNQIYYVGHTTILVSAHGGALGLSLFLPPGNGVIVELQVKEVEGNFHFEHMAYEMGHRYQMLQINREVNVDMVWKTLEDEIRQVLE